MRTEPQLGICSWSLNNDLDEVSQTMKETGLIHLHIDIDTVNTFRECIEKNNWLSTCSMISFPQEDYSTLQSIRATGGIMPDEYWPQNRALALQAINITAEYGIDYLSMHAGFMSHADAEGYRKFCSRIQELADAAQEKGVMLLLETGQETAEALRAFLNELNHPALGVNFDPANMILYGMGDPIEAIRILSPWIRHVHIKDAVKSSVAGTWGEEVPWGDGEVNCAAFMQVLEEIGYTGALAIERECGENRAEDIKLAVDRMKAIR
jgi:sugar phosphate isomerase/epimerase